MFLSLSNDKSLNYFPDNTLSAFTVRLPETLNLIGEWKVGLTDIFIPKTWYNVQEGEIWIKCFAENQEYAFAIPAGYYPTVFSLVPPIPLQFRTVPRLAIAMNFDPTTMRAAFVVTSDREIQLSPRLQTLLGFETDRLRAGWHTCPRLADFDENILYVYCDLVQDRFDGETLAPLLTWVDSSGRFGSVMHRYYERVSYHKVQKKKFQTVSIRIKDAHKRTIAFKAGRLLMTLHLRKVAQV